MQGAEKAKESLAKGLYLKLFQNLALNINKAIEPQSSRNYIGVLDIAGFGEYK